MDKVFTYILLTESMLTDIQSALTSQLGAVFSMVENAVRVCPEDVWLMEIRGQKVWHIVYHALVYVDFYGNGLDPSLTNPAEEFTPGPIFLNRYVPPFSLSESSKNSLDQEFVLEYIEYLRGKTNKMINNCTEERFLEKSGFNWLEMNNLELVMYFTRHVMQHIGQVSGYLKDRHDISIPWSGKWSSDN